MNKYERKYQKLIDELIVKSFSRLIGKRVIIEEKDTNKYRAHAKFNLSGLKIIASTQLRKFPLWKIKRILIHELCHLEIFLQWGIIRTNLDWLFYLISKKHRIKIEKEANILMIKKGYGNLLLTTLEENKKRELNYSLTEKEIKSSMKNANDTRN